MAGILNVISLWISKFQEVVYNISYSEVWGSVLLIVDAILSALFTEMLLIDNKEDVRDNSESRRRATLKRRESFLQSLIRFILVSIFFFIINVCATFLLLAFLLQFMPQKESVKVLLRRIISSNNAKFVIPLVATVLVGMALRGVTWKKRWAKPLLCMLLALSAIASSLTFIWDSVRIIQRPHYAPPVESISAIMNSRLKMYPFILSGQYIQSIGDGEEFTAVEDSEADAWGKDFEWTEEIYDEPDNFSDYIGAVIDHTFAPGKGEEDYLSSAYNLYREGRHGNDFYYIGVMWYYLAFYTELVYDEPDLTPDLCWERAIEYYQKSLEDDEGAWAYIAMALIYDMQDERNLVRKCMKKALELDEVKGDRVSFYLDHIYSWIDSEETALLMEDAKTILQYTDDLSMYILYGACAIAENQDVEGAYDALCGADEHYQGKSTMVKILGCICADLLSRNDTEVLYDIYQMEAIQGLSYIEELYLIRYLFASGRYDELWGYIDSVGTEEQNNFSVDKAVIKASWYFYRQNEAYMYTDGMETLLHRIDSELEENRYKADDKNLLLMSRALLQNLLGETEVVNIEEYDPEQISAIDCIFWATNAFNNADYDQAISYCEMFFAAEDDIKELEEYKESIRISLQELTVQEQVTLRYYMQLIFAHAHFECAKGCWKGSEEWQNHIEIAERECAAFEQSSRSLVYVEERFEELRGIICKEKGELTEEGEIMFEGTENL